MTTPAPPLARSTSFFLDLLRLVAAFSVFGGHVIMLWYPRSYSAFEDRFGERAVIIFFVLSGYVIAFSTLRRECDPRAYVLARLSRLSSVVLPALVLTAVLQIAGTALKPVHLPAVRPRPRSAPLRAGRALSSVSLVHEHVAPDERVVLVARL